MLLTTQYLEEADQLADRIAVIDHGRMIAEGPSAELKASVGTGVLHVRLAEAGDRERAHRVLAARFAETVHRDNDPRALTVQLSDPGLAAAGLADLAAAGVAVAEFSLGQPSLDEVFFALTGHPAEATERRTVAAASERHDERRQRAMTRRRSRIALIARRADASATRVLVARTARAPRAPPGGVANVLTFGWRALLKVKHMPEQLFDVIVTPVMFTVMFTFLFGGALAGSPDAYIQFLLPGILVQTVTFTTIYTGFTLNSDISKGIFDRFRSLPIWRASPIVGAMAGDTVRYTLSSLIVVVIGLILGFRPEAGVAGVVASLILLNVFGFGMSWIFVVLALIVRTPSVVMTMSWLVLMPLTFASNIFVDPATMPDWLQAFIAVNPVAILVTAVRDLMAGTATLAAIGISLIGPAVVTLICAPVAMALYARRR